MQAQTAAVMSAPREPRPDQIAPVDDRSADALGHLVAAFAHELRTPLGYVTSTVDLVQSDLEAMSPGELRAMLGRIRRGTVWLENLVENLASSASLESGRFRLRLRPLELRGCIEDALELVRPLLERRGQRADLTCPTEPLLVDGDETRLGQVFVNLLVNAHKYSAADDRFDVRVAASGRWIRVRVEDHGPGIPVEEQARIFERYERGRDAAARSSGLGLGLSLVQAIVERHGGSVGVRSTRGRGAAFVVTLPRLDRRCAFLGGGWSDEDPARGRRHRDAGRDVLFPA
jgi:signal transduction histidine kinase